MAKYDVERFCADIEALLVANFNTKLGAIDTEKNDGIVLKTIDSNGYFFQSLNNKTANYNPYILYSIENVTGKSVQGNSSMTVVLSVIIVVEDDGLDGSDMTKRILRYSRAFKEVFEENFYLAESGCTLEVQSLTPVEFGKQDSSDLYRAVGVNLIATLT